MKMLERLPGILSTKGKYSRLKYNLSDFCTHIAILVLFSLTFIHPAFIALAVVGIPLMIYIDIGREVCFKI